MNLWLKKSLKHKEKLILLPHKLATPQRQNTNTEFDEHKIHCMVEIFSSKIFIVYLSLLFLMKILEMRTFCKRECFCDLKIVEN